MLALLHMLSFDRPPYPEQLNQVGQKFTYSNGFDYSNNQDHRSQTSTPIAAPVIKVARVPAH